MTDEFVALTVVEYTHTQQHFRRPIPLRAKGHLNPRQDPELTTQKALPRDRPVTPNIFVGSEDIASQMPREAKKFEDVDKKWLKIMAEPEGRRWGYRRPR